MNELHISVNLKRRIYFLGIVFFFFAGKVGYAQDLPDAASVTVGTFPAAGSWMKSEWTGSKNSVAVSVAVEAPQIDPQVPDAPGVTVGTFPAVEPWIKSEWASSKKSGAAPVAAKAPRIDPQVADSSYWAATASLAGTTVANVELTARCEEEGTCLTWINPGKGSDRGRLYAYTVPSNFALDYLAYKLKGKTRFWIVPQMAFTAANLFSAGRSYGRIEISGWFAQKAASSRLRLSPGRP